MNKLGRSAARLSLIGLLALLIPFVSPAQSVIFTGAHATVAGELTGGAKPAGQTAGVSFGAANVCPSGQTVPSPCAQMFTLTYSFSSTETLGSPRALTLGAADLDFGVASGGSCVSGSIFHSGDSCSVNTTFAPTVPGTRNGAVELMDSGGSVLATTYVNGTGQGPMIGFQPGTVSVLGTGSVSLNTPRGVTLDGAANVWIADSLDNRIVKIASTGVSSVVGTGSLTLSDPRGVAIDGAGNLWIADVGNSRIVEITAAGAASVLSTGSVTLSGPHAVTIDGEGNLFIADSGNNRIVEVPTGGTATVLSTGSLSLSNPSGVASDTAGDIYIADVGNNRLVKITAAGAASVLDTGSFSLSSPEGVTIDGVGNVYIADSGNNRILQTTTAGAVSVLNLGSLLLKGPVGITVGGTGDIYIADTINSRTVALDLADAPEFSFDPANISSLSDDSPMTTTVKNIGNRDLIFGPGNNPTYPQDFSENSGDSNLCASGTSLAAGTTCDVSVNFLPSTSGILDESVDLADNSLNAANATQSIQVSSEGLIPTITALSTLSGDLTTYYGQTQTLIAFVTGSCMSFLCQMQPVGSVTFYENGTALGTVDVFPTNPNSTAAEFPWTPTPLGPVALWATYNPDSGYDLAGSSAPTLVLNVIAAPTTTTLSASPNPTRGQTVTLTATVSNQVGFSTPSGPVIFMLGNTVLGSATTIDGTAQFTTSGLPIGADNIVALFSQSSGAIWGPSQGAITETVQPAPSYMVTITSDDAGTPAKCSDQSLPGAVPDPGCSLRDALAAAKASGAGSITFSPTAFAGAQTITIASTLDIPSNTTITGPALGSVVTSPNPVTVNGAGMFRVFSVGVGVTNATIYGLHIIGGAINDAGGGISNSGVFKVVNSVISNNTAHSAVGGGGIFNAVGAALTAWNTTVSGNTTSGSTTGSACVGGGGILNEGTLILADSTVSGNSAVGCSGGGGILNSGTQTVTNSIVADNSLNTPASIPAFTEDDCDGASCPGDQVNGNVIGAGKSQLQPGSPGICSGLLSNIPPGLTTDQRGQPRTSLYGATTCVDSGAIETHYSLNFSQQPSDVVAGTSVTPAPAVQLSESGVPFLVSGVSIPLALVVGDDGVVNGATVSTDANGLATYATLSVSLPGAGDKLVAELLLTATPPPAPLTSPISIGVTSTSFDVTSSSQSITFTPSTSPVIYGVNSITLMAVASSNLPVTFSVLSGPAVVSGTMLNITGAGTVVVAANQAGNGNYTAAPQVTQTIQVSQAVLTLTANNATKVYGTANPVFAGTVTGSVNGDIFTESFTTTATLRSDAASYSIVPGVSGAASANYTVNVHSGTLTVIPATSMVALTSSTANADLTAPVVLTATVSSSTTGTPTGSVQFFTGSAALGTATLDAQGAATFTTSVLAASMQAIQAVYGGSADFLGSQSSLSLLITAPAYSITASPSSLTLNAGQTGQATLTLTPIGGFTGTVTLTCSGLPSGASCNFNPNTLQAGSNRSETSLMTILTQHSSAAVKANHRDGREYEIVQASLLTLPGILLGSLLGWRRRKVAFGMRHPIVVAILVFVLGGMMSCGSSPTTPTLVTGAYTLSVAATATGFPNDYKGPATETTILILNIH